MERELHFSYLYKDGNFVKVLPDVYQDKGEANLYAKMYLTLRKQKKPHDTNSTSEACFT